MTGYRLTFEENFDRFSASADGDRATWETRYWYGARTLPGNSDFLLDPSVGRVGETPYSVSNGILTIRAARTSPRLRSAGVTQPFTTGQIDTHNSFHQKYGYFEMRAKLPGIPGASSAFWLMPLEGPWPPEIDIQEVDGRYPTYLMMTNHSDAENPKAAAGSAVVADLSQDFHVFGLMWTPARLTFYLDGVALFSTPTQPDEHQPMYILAGIYVGGPAHGGDPTDPHFSAEYQIDYIRAYAEAAAP